MAESRAGRLVAGVGLGYLHTAVSIVVGVFLTPYMLGLLGEHDYGLWLLAAQTLAYLALTDVGVVALVPREVAYAVGQGHGADSDEVRSLVRRTLDVVWWQVPVVASVVGVVWICLPSAWSALSGPLAVVLVTFVALFPARLFPAMLQGLQDLAFLGVSQVAGLVVGTVATVMAARAGLGLYALAMGWAVGQVIPAAAGWYRLRSRHPHVWPTAPPSFAWSDARAQLSRGAWVSVSQVAQALLTGTDIVVIGALLGPQAVVVYACTGKLVTLLTNQPQLLLQAALPALSELRGAAARERLQQVSRAMAQLLLLASGAIVVVVLVANKAFVDNWVGASRFGGVPLTVAFVASMLARQVNFTAVYTLFCFGHERRLALTTIADGVVGLICMAVLVPMFGPTGAVIGLLVATLTVSLPANLRALGRELGMPATAFLSFWGPWLARFAVVLGCAAAMVVTLDIGGWLALGGAATAIGLIYAVMMVPEISRAPLGPMLADRLGAWTSRMPAGLRPVAASRAK